MQNRAYLNALVEYFGPNRLLGTISKLDANEVFKVVRALPEKLHHGPSADLFLERERVYAAEMASFV